jgi:hypothetical protein
LEAQDRLEGLPLHRGMALAMDGGRVGPSPFDPLAFLREVNPDGTPGRTLAEVADENLVQRLREFGIPHPLDVLEGTATEAAAPPGDAEVGTGGDADGGAAGDADQGTAADASAPTGETAEGEAPGGKEAGDAEGTGEFFFQEDPTGLDWVEGMWGCDRIVGSYERHVRVLPTYPAFEVRHGVTFERSR